MFKNLNNKYRAIQKPSEATGDLIGNKMMMLIMKQKYQKKIYNCVDINDLSKETYNTGSQTKFRIQQCESPVYVIIVMYIYLVK